LKGNISKDEALEDPDAVLDVLQFESNRTAAKAAPESDTPLPAEKNITLSKTATAISSSCFLSNSSFLDNFQTIWLAKATRRPYTWSQRRLAKGKSHTIGWRNLTNPHRAAGEVFLALDSTNGNKEVAIKKMSLTAQNIRLLTTEIAIMKDCKHTNIVGYLDSYRVEDKLWVAMEFMVGVPIYNRKLYFNTLLTLAGWWLFD